MLINCNENCNADKTKYIIMSRDQNAGRSYSMKIDSSSIDRVEEFKHLGTMLTNQILFRKKLRADCSQGLLAIIWCRNFCLPGCYPKTYRLRYTKL